jgi:hypothetical protein
MFESSIRKNDGIHVTANPATLPNTEFAAWLVQVPVHLHRLFAIDSGECFE